ncbi:MAG: hypothetical protein EON87_21825 [Brevundimonas sp.]|nr:MAG: hypothetical protein EON87_21825 [Brevundimonas sp.]
MWPRWPPTCSRTRPRRSRRLKSSRCRPSSRARRSKCCACPDVTARRPSAPPPACWRNPGPRSS